MDARQITIRPCTELAEFLQCSVVQKTVWGDADRELVPPHIFVVAQKTGGQIFGAYDGAQMIGYLLAMVGVRGGAAYLHSHMAAVLPEYQNCGVGKNLKLAQRGDALARGFELIEWTFDPLKIRNANFNVNKLGAIVRTYLPNVYGQTSSHLDAGLPTDRFVAEWHLKTDRVQKILSGNEYTAPSSATHVFVPAQNQTIEVQTKLREQLQKLFADGCALTQIINVENGAEYVVEEI